MGQKTHPVGFRLSVNKRWNSIWFAEKNNFSKSLEEDVNIRKYISYRLPNAGISKVEINRTSKKVSVTIHTARPGIVIGRGGEEVNKLKKELRQLTNKKDAQINISEVKRPELNAAFLANNLWLLVATILVIFMNAGFAMVEAGMCRQKNAVNILAKNLFVFALAVTAYWFVGYSLMYGDPVSAGWLYFNDLFFDSFIF